MPENVYEKCERDLTLQVLKWEVLIASTEQPGRQSGLIEKAKVTKNQVREKAKANTECFMDMSKTGMRRKYQRVLHRKNIKTF